jgi:hypothetical protein
MRDQWACPDRAGRKPPGYENPIPGSREAFDDCPAYYLRTAGMGLPAEHLIDGVTHPAELVQGWAFEVEAGARMIDTLSPKGTEGIHVHIREKRSREVLEDEMRKRKKGAG